MSRFSVGNFLPHSAENLCEEPLNVSKKFWYGKNMKKRCLSRFHVNIFLSHSAEKVRGEPSCVSEKFWYGRKI